MNVAFFVLNLILGIGIPLALQLRDRRRLTTAERDQAWNVASWGSALYNFGPLSLVAWGYVTRTPRYWRGLAWGAGLAEIALLAQGIIAEVLGRILAFKAKGLDDTRTGFLATMVAVIALALLVGAGRAAYEGLRALLRADPIQP